MYAPTFSEALALRVVKDSIAYRLEISRLPEYNKVLHEIREYQNLYSSPRTEDSSMTFTEKMLSSYKSRQDSIKYVRELYKSYRPTPASFEISEKFALKLYDKISVLIRDFKAVRVQEYDPGIIITIIDGESVTFRCVAGDELWSLKVHDPQNVVLEMSDLFNMMITESKAGQPIDEAKYIKLLKKIKP